MTLNLIAQAGNEAITPWAEHGLAGLVIFALFGLVFFVLRGHKVERREWTVDARDRETTRVVQNESFIKVQSAMTDAVKELTKGQQEAIVLQRQMREDHIRDKAVRDAGS